MPNELENQNAASGAEDNKPKTKAPAPAKEKKEAAPEKEAKKAVTKPSVRTEKKVIEGNPIVKIDDKEYEVKTPLFNVIGFGTFTNKEAATNDKLLRHLLEMGSSVLKEVF